MTDLIHEALFAFMKTAGTSAANRFYPRQLPQQPVLPAGTYFQVSDPPEHTQSGPSKLRHPRFQIECWGVDTETTDGYQQARFLAEEVRMLLEGYSGVMGDLEIGVAFAEDGKDDYDPNTFRHKVILDVIIWYSSK